MKTKNCKILILVLMSLNLSITSSMLYADDACQLHLISKDLGDFHDSLTYSYESYVQPGSNNTIISRYAENAINILSPDLNLIAKIKPKSNFNKPLILADGSIVVASRNNNEVAIYNSDGSLNHSFVMEQEIRAQPQLTADGKRLILRGKNNTTYFTDFNGKILSKFTPDKNEGSLSDGWANTNFFNEPILVTNAKKPTYFVPARDGIQHSVLHVLDDNGKLLARYSFQDTDIPRLQGQFKDGTVLMSTTGNNESLYTFSQDGKLLGNIPAESSTANQIKISMDFIGQNLLVRKAADNTMNLYSNDLKTKQSLNLGMDTKIINGPFADQANQKVFLLAKKGEAKEIQVYSLTNKNELTLSQKISVSKSAWGVKQLGNSSTLVFNDLTSVYLVKDFGHGEIKKVQLWDGSDDLASRTAIIGNKIMAIGNSSVHLINDAGQVEAQTKINGGSLYYSIQNVFPNGTVVIDKPNYTKERKIIKAIDNSNSAKCINRANSIAPQVNQVN